MDCTQVCPLVDQQVLELRKLAKEYNENTCEYKHIDLDRYGSNKVALIFSLWFRDFKIEGFGEPYDKIIKSHITFLDR